MVRPLGSYAPHHGCPHHYQHGVSWDAWACQAFPWVWQPVLGRFQMAAYLPMVAYLHMQQPMVGVVGLAAHLVIAEVELKLAVQLAGATPVADASSAPVLASGI